MTAIALLAPVPYQHIESAFDQCTRQGRVAFGSNAWEVMPEIEAARAGLAEGEELTVYIYVSQDGRDSAEWIGVLDAVVREPTSDLDQLRPATTASDGASAYYWIVRGLKPLADSAKRLNEFTNATTGKSIRRPPRQPLLVFQPQ